jgi:hypothetical protein
VSGPGPVAPPRPVPTRTGPVAGRAAARNELAAGVDDLCQSRAEAIRYSLNDDPWFRQLGRRRHSRSAPWESDRIHGVDQFVESVKTTGCGGRVDLAIPTAEHDGGGFGVPRRSQLQVAAPDVCEEHTIGRRCGHVLSMHTRRVLPGARA